MMAFPTPKLDDRSFDDLMREAREIIAARAPGWTDHSPGDPGIVLVELFAFLTENMLYRLNRVPEKVHIALLNLLGVTLQAPAAAVALELGGLFYLGPTPWGRAVPVPGSSPMFARLKQEKDVGLVAGRLQNLPVRAGFRVSYPVVGITPPSPNYLLQSSIIEPPAKATSGEVRWQWRFGVTHGIWELGDDVRGTDLIAEGVDPVLGILLDAGKYGKDRQRWKLVRYREPLPPAWVATRVKEAGNWGPLYTKLEEGDCIGEAWFLPGDLPAEVRNDPTWNRAVMRYGLGVPRESDVDLGPPATKTKIVDWDGWAGTVEHDGSCVLVVRRAAYPGWNARINDGPERPVPGVNGGLQGVILTGKGPSRIALSYHPTRLNGGKAMSLSAVVAAVSVIAGSSWRARRKG